MDSYLPVEWYRASIERDGTRYTLEVEGRFQYGGQTTYRASIDAAASCVWHYDRTPEEANPACANPRFPAALESGSSLSRFRLPPHSPAKRPFFLPIRSLGRRLNGAQGGTAESRDHEAWDRIAPAGFQHSRARQVGPLIVDRLDAAEDDLVYQVR